ncbi:MAG: response regulator transcription factor [Algicola sp.]|nr:response regulator transcription factor [Algicola sp.]
MTIKVLIVDDEPLAREGVALRLEGQADMQVIGECSNGKDAITVILEKKPDLVFLDIKMPKVTGFDVVKSVGVEHMPQVIFLTAYNEFAVEAFRINALDYLLKPINGELFKNSLNRAREQISKSRIAHRSKQLSSLLSAHDEHQSAAFTQNITTTANTDNAAITGNSDRMVIRSQGNVYFVNAMDIYWVEADGDYINIHTAQKSHLLRETMRKMEQRLQTHGFQRIHRSTIVKLSVISELSTSDNGEYEVILTNGTRLKLSRTYRDLLFEKLQAD